MGAMPRCGEGGQRCHDEADADVPIGRLVIEGADDEQRNANSQRNEFPRAGQFMKGVQSILM